MDRFSGFRRWSKYVKRQTVVSLIGLPPPSYIQLQTGPGVGHLQERTKHQTDLEHLQEQLKLQLGLKHLQERIELQTGLGHLQEGMKHHTGLGHLQQRIKLQTDLEYLQERIKLQTDLEHLQERIKLQTGLRHQQRSKHQTDLGPRQRLTDQAMAIHPGPGLRDPVSRQRRYSCVSFHDRP